MTHRAIEEWLATRPESVQQLAKKYPLLSTINNQWYVIGYTENDMLVISTIHPVQDYKLSIANRKYVCVEHLMDQNESELNDTRGE